MKWRAWRLTYKLASPLHVGHTALGSIRLSRRYIPGRAMWGAMTAVLARSLGEGTPADYARFGRLLQGDIRISYFFPATEDQHPLIPRYTPRGMRFGASEMPAETFEKKFLGSFVQTAIATGTITAEEGALHESEYLFPQTSCSHDDRPTELPSLLFIGYLFMRSDAKLEGAAVSWRESEISLLPALERLVVGGDRKYGWGRMVLVNQPEDEGPQQDAFDCRFVGEGDLPSIDLPSGRPAPGHLSIQCRYPVRGELEPLAGREWMSKIGATAGGPSSAGPGQKIVDAGVFWAPGSMVVDHDLRLEIQPMGILEARKEESAD